jgi:ABC-type Fe3+-hydroxamate transport system substrate-binding protein
VPSWTLRDDLGRELRFSGAPARVVSLVPSDTHSVIALGGVARLVGRTRYCEDPEAAGVAVVGGTKDVDVAAVIALAPDLVLANQEENARPALERLVAAGRRVLIALPRRVDDGVAHLARLARILELGRQEPARGLLRRAYQRRPPATGPRRRAFVPIWGEPLMTLNGDTFGSDVLAHVGVDNVFGDRLRLHPLAADLGKAPAEEAAGRDVRYPRVTVAEVVARAPEVVILPDEPHAWSAAEEEGWRAALPGAAIVRVSGKDLFWSGAWTLDALPRLAARLAG